MFMNICNAVIALVPFVQEHMSMFASMPLVKEIVCSNFMS